MNCPKCKAEDATLLKTLNLRPELSQLFEAYICKEDACKCAFLVETDVEAPEKGLPTISIGRY